MASPILNASGNTNTNINGQANANTNINTSGFNGLANTSMDSSFSFSGGITHSNTFSGTFNSNSSSFNRNSFMGATNTTNTIHDELGNTTRNTSSPFLTPSLSNYQNNMTSSPLRKSYTVSGGSNPFSSPSNPSGSSSYGLGNPFGSPTSPIKPFNLETSPALSSSAANLSRHGSLLSHDNFKLSSPMMNPTASPSMVATHLPGAQSIHSNFNTSMVATHPTGTQSIHSNFNTSMVATHLTGVQSTTPSTPSNPNNPFEGII